MTLVEQQLEPIIDRAVVRQVGLVIPAIAPAGRCAGLQDTPQHLGLKLVGVIACQHPPHRERVTQLGKAPGLVEQQLD